MHIGSGGHTFLGAAVLFALATGVARLVQAPKKRTGQPYDHDEPAAHHTAVDDLKVDFVSRLGELRIEDVFGTAGVALSAKTCAKELRLIEHDHRYPDNRRQTRTNRSRMAV